MPTMLFCKNNYSPRTYHMHVGGVFSNGFPLPVDQQQAPQSAQQAGSERATITMMHRWKRPAHGHTHVRCTTHTRTRSQTGTHIHHSHSWLAHMHHAPTSAHKYTRRWRVVTGAAVIMVTESRDSSMRLHHQPVVPQPLPALSTYLGGV